MKKNALLTLIAVAMMLLSTGCSNQEEKTKNAAPMSVRSEVVHPSSDIDTKSYIGIVEEELAISVGFAASGTISKVCVSEGQTVKKGQLIAELDKTQAENMLAMAKAQMEQANDAYKRLKLLHDNNSLPEMEWVEVQSKVQQAEASLEMAKKSLADCCIYAPESGIIGKGVMNVGEVVLPALPVAKILVIDHIKIRASVPEKEVAAITSSTPSQITCIASRSADWVFGGVRLISSASSRFVKTGPFTKRKTCLPVVRSSSSTSVPVTSAGIRSGVNWTRLNPRSITSARVRTSSVFASPGTPVSSA